MRGQAQGSAGEILRAATVRLLLDAQAEACGDSPTNPIFCD